MVGDGGGGGNDAFHVVSLFLINGSLAVGEGERAIVGGCTGRRAVGVTYTFIRWLRQNFQM